MTTTKTIKPAKLHLQIIAAAREVGESVPQEGVNQWLINYYKRTTGAEIFRTFSEWKKCGYHVTQGQKGFPVFSRPIGAIKQEAGKEATEQEFGRFGTAYLFNENQVLKK